MAASIQTRLPGGRPGRLLAVALLLLLAAALWVGVASPLLDWHGERAAALEQEALLARRMARVAAGLPALERRAEAASGPAAPSLLEGATDDVAAAALQEQVQAMAARAGATLSSAETVPAAQAGGYRQIGLRVSLRAPWPALVHVLQAIGGASPRMLVDNLQLHGARLAGISGDQPLEAAFEVIAFRAVAPPPSGPGRAAAPGQAP